MTQAPLQTKAKNKNIRVSPGGLDAALKDGEALLHFLRTTRRKRFRRNFLVYYKDLEPCGLREVHQGRKS
ncbi:MAG: hypothetical protein ABSB35_42125 [Bryobacteraceae bacterium]|jgi:hypothetical protein